MNELFTKDRMARNSADFDGSGVGSGYYSEREEKRLKWENLKLPLVLLGFTVLIWAAILGSTIPEIDIMLNGTKATAQRDSDGVTGAWEAPDGKRYYVDLSWTDKNAQQVTVYYKGDDYSGAVAPMSWAYWVLFYGFAVAITVIIFFWMKTILVKKKHAVPRAEKSYKDY